MAVTIQFRRGNASAVAGIATVAEGEPIYAKDIPQLWMGVASNGKRLMAVQNNFNATTAPTVNDDAGDGYSVNSIWTDTTADVSYICKDATVGAAVWQTLGAGGGVTDHGALTGLGDDDHTQYVLSAGRTGGQHIYGANDAGEELILESTSHATKGLVIIPDVIRLSNRSSAGTPAATTGFLYPKTDKILYYKNEDGVERALREGTVTSVGLTLPGELFAGSGTPITSAGNVSDTLATHTANTIFAGPSSGGAATPAFRAMVTGDLPGGNWVTSNVATRSVLGGTFSVSADSTWQDVTNGGTNCEVSITAGTWLVIATARAQVVLTAGSGNMSIMLRNITDSSDVSNSELCVIRGSASNTVSNASSASLAMPITVTGTKTIRMRAWRDGGGATYSTSNILSDSVGRTSMVAIRIA